MAKLIARIKSSSPLEYLLICVITLGVFYPSLTHPILDIDEIIWGEFANRVIAGCAPYVCFPGEKPPLLYLFFAGVFQLFGKNSYLASHAIHALWIATTAFFLNRIPGGPKPLLPGIFYILLFALPGFRGLAPSGEGLMNLFMVLSWIALLRSIHSQAFRSALLAGICVGMASLFRHQAGIQILAWPLALLFTVPLRSALRLIFAIGLGVALTWALAGLGIYLWGAWPEFYHWVVEYNFKYVESGGHGPGAWREAFLNLLQLFGSTAFFWLLLIPARWHHTEGALKKTAWVYLGFGLLATLPGLRFYPHYFFQAYPPLAILAAGGWQVLRDSRIRWVKLLGPIGLALSCIGVLAQNLLVDKIMNAGTLKDYSPVNREVGEYLKKNSQPEDRLFIWGWGHLIYYYSGLSPAVRFMHSDPLSGRISASDPRDYGTKQALARVPPKNWDIFLEDMARNRPRYWLDTSPAGMHSYENFPLQAYPVLKKLLEEHYQLETEIGGVRVYRRTDDSPSS